ncbi:MAG: hypothetical protein WB646_05030 [Steroidobacteraceae bacterium]
MSVRRSTRKWLWITALWVVALAGIATSFAEEPGHEGRAFAPHGQVLDNRHNHGHYYPRPVATA